MRPHWQGGDKSHFSFPSVLAWEVFLLPGDSCMDFVSRGQKGFHPQRVPDSFVHTANNFPLVQQELHRDLQTCVLGVIWWPKLPSSFSNIFKSDWDIKNKNQPVIKVCINRKLLLFFSSPRGSKCLICSAFQENHPSFIRKIRAPITHFHC